MIHTYHTPQCNTIREYINDDFIDKFRRHCPRDNLSFRKIFKSRLPSLRPVRLIFQTQSHSFLRFVHTENPSFHSLSLSKMFSCISDKCF